MTEPRNTDPAAQAKTPATQAPPAMSVAQAADARVAELEAENARLREQLAAAGQTVAAGKPHEPSFMFSAGQADELERTGRTVSPFTGMRYVGTSTADAHEATPEEFDKAKPPVKTETGTDQAPARVGRRK